MFHSTSQSNLIQKSLIRSLRVKSNPNKSHPFCCSGFDFNLGARKHVINSKKICLVPFLLKEKKIHKKCAKFVLKLVLYLFFRKNQTKFIQSWFGANFCVKFVQKEPKKKISFLEQVSLKIFGPFLDRNRNLWFLYDLNWMQNSTYCISLDSTWSQISSSNYSKKMFKIHLKLVQPHFIILKRNCTKFVLNRPLTFLLSFNFFQKFG